MDRDRRSDALTPTGAETPGIGFWRAHLASAPPSLQLPLDGVAAAPQAQGIAHVERPLPPTEPVALASLLAAWAIQLARLSGQSEVVIGVPTQAAAPGATPQPYSVAPLCLCIDPDAPVASIVRQAAETAAQAARHQDVPLERIAADTGNATLFQAMLSVEGTPGLPPMATTPQAPAEAPDAIAARTALHLAVHAGASPRIRLAYDTALFDAGAAQRLADQFVQVLASLRADPAQAAGALDPMPAGERRQVLTGFNDTAIDFPRDELIHAPFERLAAARPDGPALRFGDRTLSYAELNRLANRVAHRLIGLGVRPDDRVGLCAERSVEMVAGLLGILKAGGAYVPLDPGYPADRLAHMHRDSAPAVLLTQSHLAGRVPAGDAPVVLLDTDAQLAAQPGHDPDPAALGLAATHLAYVIYTSGSTGLPKGVMNEHRGVVNRLAWAQRTYGLDAHDRVLQKTPFSFDVSVWEFFWTLRTGAQLVVARPEGHKDPAYLAGLVRAEGVTTMHFVPSMLQAFLAHEALDGLGSLRRVLCSGEALPAPLARRFHERLPGTELHNLYGPTEAAVDVSAWACAPGAAVRAVPIGRPVDNTRLYVLDARLQPVPIGAPGEIHIGGVQVARGYLNRPELTAERFIADPFSQEHGARLYKTGDLGRWLADGSLEYLGRNDFQVKIRGFRIELGEIETCLAACPGVREAVVVAREDVPGDPRLVAYLSAHDGAALSTAALRETLAAALADYMVPAAFVVLPALPLTPSGKVDRKALPKPEGKRPDWAAAWQAPIGDFEAQACAVFEEALGIAPIGRDDNFFEFGGSSLLAMQALQRLAERTGRSLSAPTIFAHPTPAGLARAAAGEVPQPALPASRAAAGASEPIAIVGMAGRFPGAADVEALWRNLLAGHDAITRFTPETLDASVPAAVRNDPSYVPARGVVEGVEMFDNAFFGISAREAELLDPQHRLFLELCWECLERAGYGPGRIAQPVGVFGGIYGPSYLQRHVMAHPEAMERAGELQVLLANDKDYAALRVAHKLNLTGPAVAVHTACSTSLVAIAQAVDSLRLGRCDMALAGGVSVTSPPNTGYFHNDGSMLSGDGHTRTFDADANGTVFNDGGAFVLLKPLSLALADGDTVYALIRAVATNNDGGGKASFTAPSVEGQAAVIAMAHREAEVEARSISYVEAHGTATPLGDPVEVEALTRAFRLGTPDAGFCGIGSVKSNIGHLVAAAGAASVIKTALALHTQQLPATIHFRAPNPKIGFAGSPFVVQDRLADWPRGELPRRAGVSNFGVGGTNAHAVLEEAPARPPSSPAEGAQLLQLSARTPAALERMAAALADHLAADPAPNLADVAHTLQHGRTVFAHRLCVAAETVQEAVEALRNTASPARAVRTPGAGVPPLVWLFPGQGAQYAGMGRTLYARDAAFRDAFDACRAALDGALPFDLRARMFDGGPDALTATEVTQPATFCIEYALAQSWLARGARPAALIGHSVGEFVCAVLAGVMPLADAARLVARRGAMMQALPPGRMLSVRLAAARLQAMLPPGVSLAAENAPGACVVAGPAEAIEAFQAELEKEGIVARRLQTSHAFHSAMMDPAVAPFEAEVRRVPLAAPALPIVSTLTGTWLREADATDPHYWARHLREPVRFSPALHEALARHADAAFLEIGPRGTLATLARQHARPGQPAPAAVASLGDAPEGEDARLLLAQGHLWALGVPLTAANASPAEGRRRVRLPTYPFERKRFWLAPAPAAAPTLMPSPPSSSETVAMPIATPSAASAPTDRRAQLVPRLRALFEDVAGLDLGGSDPGANFVELGLDSLALTQAAIQVKRQFGVALSFRQLMENQCSLEALAAFVDAALPPEAAAPAEVPAAAPVMPTIAPPVLPHAAMPAPGGGTLLQQLIQQQMQLMQQQLALLSAAPTGPSSPVLAAPPVEQFTPGTSAAVPASNTPAEPEPEAATPVRYDVKKAFGAIARIHTQAGALTDRQRARLDAFARRYVERTRKSRDYTAAHRAHLADPRVVNGFRPVTKEITYQVIVERSKGAHLWDLDGNEYVDALNGFGMSLFGWQPEFVNTAVHRQLDTGYEIGPMHPLAGEVAKLLCELTGFDRAGLCNTGSEAVMAALRIARTVTGRQMIVSFSGSYHGTFDEVLVRAGRRGHGIPAAPGIMPGMFGDIHVLDYGTPEALAFIRAHADELAAVLVEPVQSRRPDFQPREFLREVREITAKSGACLIFDEVITGFRSHLGGAQALFGVRADLATYGKVIGGGFPIGAIAGRREFMDALDGGAWAYGDDSVPTAGVTYFAGTFVRHPLALAAAKASLEHLKAAGPALQTQLNVHTAAMADELGAFCREVGAPIEIRHFASLWRVTWLEDHPLQDLLFAMMRSRGVHILDNFPCFMTTAHTQQDIAVIKSAFKESVAELQEAGFLPRRAAAPSAFDAAHPPVPHARLGRDRDGQPAWFVPDPAAPGKFVKVEV